jgi:hypothetical protein
MRRRTGLIHHVSALLLPPVVLLEPYSRSVISMLDACLYNKYRYIVAVLPVPDTRSYQYMQTKMHITQDLEDAFRNTTITSGADPTQA